MRVIISIAMLQLHCRIFFCVHVCVSTPSFDFICVVRFDYLGESTFRTQKHKL